MIRLLHNLDNETFLRAHEPESVDEDERSGQIDEAMKECWDKVQAG
jgi:hypothetical protein